MIEFFGRWMRCTTNLGIYNDVTEDYDDEWDDAPCMVNLDNIVSIRPNMSDRGETCSFETPDGICGTITVPFEKVAKAIAKYEKRESMLGRH